MNYNLTPFLISIWSGIWFFFLFFLTDGLWLGRETTLSEHTILWIIIWILWILIWITRNAKDKNTQFLTKITICIEVYLFLLIFLQPTINLSQTEFLVLYLASIGLVHEFLTVRYKKRQKYLFTTCYGLIFLFMISIAIFMQWRVPFDEQNFIDHQNYILTTHFNEKLSPRYTKILLINNNKKQNIPIQPVFQMYSLDKNTEYQLIFSTQDYEKENFITIQDPEWNLLKIPSQSQLNFSTSEQKIKIHHQIWKIKKISYQDTNFPELLPLQTTYKWLKKSFALKTIPSRLAHNPKFLKRSIKYTSFLSKFFPFWYQEYTNNIKTYLPYLEIKHKEIMSWSIKFDLQDNISLWTKKTEWTEKYLQYTKDFFKSLF